MTQRQDKGAGIISHKEEAWRVRESLILDIAISLIKSSSYEGLTMQRIADNSGYSKGTIYQHFNCKENVVGKLLVLHGRRLELFIDNVLDYKASLRFKIILVGWGFLVNAEETPELSILLSSSRSPNFQDKLSPIIKNELAELDGSILSKVMHMFIDRTDISLDKVKAVIFGLWSMEMGVQDLMFSQWKLSRLGFDDPKKSFFDALHILLDGFGIEADDSSLDYEVVIKRASLLFKSSMIKIRN